MEFSICVDDDQILVWIVTCQFSQIYNTVMVLGCVNFHKFTIQLWSLVIVKLLFLLNVLGTNGSDLTKFSICIDIVQI